MKAGHSERRAIEKTIATLGCVGRPKSEMVATGRTIEKPGCAGRPESDVKSWSAMARRKHRLLLPQNRVGHRRTLRPTPNTSDLGREVHRPTYVGGRNEESHRDAEKREIRIRTVSNISILDFSSKKKT